MEPEYPVSEPPLSSPATSDNPGLPETPPVPAKRLLALRLVSLGLTLAIIVFLVLIINKLR
ncbi:MAG: hypothetical protein WCO44_05635 [Bacteroidota bacterium]